jgi:hypothetical protein
MLSSSDRATYYPPLLTASQALNSPCWFAGSSERTKRDGYQILKLIRPGPSDPLLTVRLIGSDATLDEIFVGSLEREGGFRGTGSDTIGYTVESIPVPASIQERALLGCQWKNRIRCPPGASERPTSEEVEVLRHIIIKFDMNHSSSVYVNLYNPTIRHSSITTTTRTVYSISQVILNSNTRGLRMNSDSRH